MVSSRTVRVCRLLAVLAVVGSAGVATAAAARDRNNYYSYTDDRGILHVTNVPQKRPGAWKLWRSLESTERKGPAPAEAMRPGPVDLGAERLHRFDSFLLAAAGRYQLPESLLRAVVHTESNYNPRAVSRAGAMGLMQLMPATARALGVESPFDPEQNIHGGARYLRLLANRYDGDMILVLAAYNAGAGNVERYGGVPPFEETRAYVRAVLQRYYAYERQVQLGQATLRRAPARHVQP